MASTRAPVSFFGPALQISLASLLFVPAASATGQEMAGFAVYLAGVLSLLLGGAISLMAAAIVLVIAWRRGTLRARPWRVLAGAAAIAAAGPILLFLGFVASATVEDMRKYPLQYAWLTGARPQASIATQPHTPPPNVLTQSRDWFGLLAQDIVRWWHYDADIEKAERNASERARQPAGN